MPTVKKYATFDERILTCQENAMTSATQREQVTDLMNHLAEFRTLSTMGRIELSDSVLNQINALNHKVQEEVKAAVQK